MPFAETNGARLYYAESGSGEPILLIPGLGLDHNYYRLAIPTFERAMTVFAVDPRELANPASRSFSIRSKPGPTILRR
jgi:pimeloyl-ACP methyl ester carboxylesterase